MHDYKEFGKILLKQPLLEKFRSRHVFVDYDLDRIRTVRFYLAIFCVKVLNNAHIQNGFK